MALVQLDVSAKIHFWKLHKSTWWNKNVPHIPWTLCPSLTLIIDTFWQQEIAVHGWKQELNQGKSRYWAKAALPLDWQWQLSICCTMLCRKCWQQDRPDIWQQSVSTRRMHIRRSSSCRRPSHSSVTARDCSPTTTPNNRADAVQFIAADCH